MTEAFFKSAKAAIENQLHELVFSSEGVPYTSLFTAARYSLLSEGKRLRPLLVLAVAESYGTPMSHALHPACALELVHTYSLIHDDLPCMDDDALRRGKPTLHKVYPEWHALLTGDYLLTYAFEILADAPHLSAEQKIVLVRTLSSHAGAHGMIGGQMIDLLCEGQTTDWEILEQMHRGKTAALITAALEFGGIIARAPADDVNLLKKIGHALGIAFQLIDDILDAPTSDRNKSTAVSLLGIPATKAKADQLLQTASDCLAALTCPTPLLRTLFDQMVNRKN